MNDQPTTAAPTPEPRRKPAEKKVTVTLTRGTDYSLLFKGASYRFSQGEAKDVPADVAEHLRQNAIDIVTVEDMPEKRSKFAFEV